MNASEANKYGHLARWWKSSGWLKSTATPRAKAFAKISGSSRSPARHNRFRVPTADSRPLPEVLRSLEQRLPVRHIRIGSRTVDDLEFIQRLRILSARIVVLAFFPMFGQ